MVAGRALIAPASLHGIIGIGFRIVAAEQSAQVFGVLKTLLDQRRSICVGKNILLEPFIMGQHIIDDAAQERDIRAGANRHIEVAERRCARKMRVDVDQCRAFLLGLHGPSETDRVRLGHVRAHDQDAIAIGQVLLVVGGRTAAERGAQTGHRGGVSSSGLVLDRDNSQPAAEQLLDQVVVFNVERRAAQGPHVPHGVQHATFLIACREVRVTRCLDAPGDLVERPVKGSRLPFIRIGGPVKDGLDAMRVDGKEQRVGALGAKGSLVDRAAGRPRYRSTGRAWCKSTGRSPRRSRDRGPR